MATRLLDLNSIADYELFLKIKALPRSTFVGREAHFADEYASLLGIDLPPALNTKRYRPRKGLFDYQAAIAKIACRKERFAVFAQPGLGKTRIASEFCRYALSVLPKNKCALWVTPPMIINETCEELENFYEGKFTPTKVPAKDLKHWLKYGDRFGICSYNAIVENLPYERIECMHLDESSLLKSAYGAWGQRLIYMGKGKRFKLCSTGTPAPNDRIEYANHAVFLDQFPNVDSFLAKYFINRGEKSNRWEMKPYAIKPLYQDLSHWSIFLSDPSVYGWKDNVNTLPKINVYMEIIDATEDQRYAAMEATGSLYGEAGGMVSRSKLSQIAKGHLGKKKFETKKPECIRDLVESFVGKSTIVWCEYNAEQDHLAKLLPQAANIDGRTKDDERARLIHDFKTGKITQLISKGDILGWGMNLQICTKMVFSTLSDSYEKYWQCVKRANRIGSTEDLDVYAPILEIEYPMFANIFRKAVMIESDNLEQERLFKEGMLHEFS